MSEDTQEHRKTPTIEEQNPFGIHTQSEDERMDEMRRVARFADERLLEQLSRQHPVVAALVAEVESLREKVAAKKPKKPKADEPFNTDPNA